MTSMFWNENVLYPDSKILDHWLENNYKSSQVLKTVHASMTKCSIINTYLPTKVSVLFYNTKTHRFALRSSMSLVTNKNAFCIKESHSTYKTHMFQLMNHQNHLTSHHYSIKQHRTNESSIN